MKNKMYMIYCADTYITCFIDNKDIKHEIFQDGLDVRVTIIDYFYNYRTFVYYCNCTFIIKEV